VKTPTRLLLTVLLALGIGLGQPTFAHAGGGDNAAVAVNTKDGSSLFKFAFAIHKAAQDVVDDKNSAVAYASCTSCQTVAIAIDVVLVTGQPSVFTPQNVALAVNENCNFCDTFASAYQFVVQSGGPVHFTHDGHKQLEDIRKEIAKWGKDGLTPAQMREQLPALIDEVQQILKTQIVSGGPDQGDEQGTDTSDGGPPASPTNGATTTTGGGEATVPAGGGEATVPADTGSTSTSTTPTDTAPASGTTTAPSTTTEPAGTTP
jgi:putative peptide zinc metalloprotease protein